MTGFGPAGPTDTLPAPFRSGPYAIRADWIDYNGHLNLAYYVLLFDQATDALWAPLGLGGTLRAAGFATFAVETHTQYRSEVLGHDTVAVESQLLAVDGKRLHLLHEMRRLADGVVAARQELLYLCVSFETRRAALWPDAAADALRRAVSSHAVLAAPDWVGRRIAMPSPAGSVPSASRAPGLG